MLKFLQSNKGDHSLISLKAVMLQKIIDYEICKQNNFTLVIKHIAIV